MAQFFSRFVLLLATGLALGPGDPVGVDDGALDRDLEPGARQQVSIEKARSEALRAMAELEDPLEPRRASLLESRLDFDQPPSMPSPATRALAPPSATSCLDRG
jgi:hypothetical protein